MATAPFRLQAATVALQGTSRRVTVLLDNGATRPPCRLPPSGQPGLVSVLTAAPGGRAGAGGADARQHLCVGDKFREILSVSTMDMDVGDDLFLGWDCISSHDLYKFYVDGHVSLRPGPARLHLDLLPSEAPTARGAPRPARCRL